MGLRLWDTALDLARVAGDRGREGFVLGDLGMILDRAGRHDEARRHLDLALALHRKDGNPLGEARVLNQIGLLLRHQGRPSEAADRHREAAEVYRAMGNRSDLAAAHNGLGEALLASAPPDRTAAGREAAFDRPADVHETAPVEHEAALGQAAGGREAAFDRAAAELEAAGCEAAFNRAAGGRETAGCEAALGRAAGGRETALDGAAAGHETALELAVSARNRPKEARARHGLAGVHLYRAEWDAAARQAESARRLYASLGVPEADDAYLFELLARAERPPDDPPVRGAGEDAINALADRFPVRPPEAYLSWLRFCNGSAAGPGGIFGTDSVAETLAIFPGWAEQGRIPVAGDRCGNYYVLDAGSGAVYFIDTMEGDDYSYLAGSGLPHFLRFLLSRQAGVRGWPFDRAFVTEADPAILQAGAAELLPWNAGEGWNA